MSVDKFDTVTISDYSQIHIISNIATPCCTSDELKVELEMFYR